jgi:hypothetical protein
MAAAVLGFCPEAIYILIRERKLKPLGKPRPGAQKFFAAEEIRRRREDTKWLSEATDAVSDCYAKKNGERNRRDTDGPGGLEDPIK